jgi:hypothetical protein
LFQRLTVEQNRGHMEFNRESQELEAEIRDLEGQLYYRAGLEYGDLVAVERTLTEVLPTGSSRCWSSVADAVSPMRSLNAMAVALNIELERERGINTLQRSH